MEKLTSSLKTLKATQAETFSVLPQPPPFRVPTNYKNCQSLDDVVAVAGDSHDIPHIPLLQHAMAELSSQKARPTAEAIFQLLESKFSWFQTEEGAEFEVNSQKSCSFSVN